MSILQNIIVGVIVGWAMWVTAVRLLPRALRAAVRKRAARMAGFLGWARFAQQLAAPAIVTGSCAGCDNCKDQPGSRTKADGVVGTISAKALRRTIRR